MKNNKKNKKHENKKALIIIAILLIIALIAGGTYAYWTWNSNNIVRVGGNTVVGNFSLTLDGGTGSNKVVLAPTDCRSSSIGNYVDQKTIKVTYQNTTAFPAHAVLKLNLSSFTFENGTPTDTALGHLHYAITTGSTSCTSNTLSTSDANTISITGNGTSTTPATFVGKTSAGSNLITWDYMVPANTTTATTKTYYLYVWIDKDYTYQNVGNGVVSDPLQDMKYNLAWSIQNNQIIQYAG